MRDLTMEIAKAKELRDMEKQNAERKKYNDLLDTLEKILQKSAEMDIFIKNGEALRKAGFIPKGRYEEDSLESITFYANRWSHRLGFMSLITGEIDSLGILGGGANGDVSVIYYDGVVWLGNEDGALLYDLCNLRKEVPKVVTANLNNYLWHAKRFLEHLDDGTFETTLSKKIDSLF